MSIPRPTDLDNAERRSLDEGVFTVKHLVASFLTHLKLMVRAQVNAPGTLRWYTDQLAHLKGLNSFPADALRTHHLASIDLTNAFTRALKRLYKWGASEELVPKDPFVKLIVPPCGRRERVLTRPELACLYLASPRAFRRLLFVQLRTIARPGEIRNLTWGQIDWANRVILLTEFKGKKRRKDKLKARPIPLDLVVLRLLANLHRRSPDKSPEGRVFWSPRGKPWTPNGVRCAMRRARLRAGLDDGGERVVCYSLRHTAATRAIRAEVPVKMVAEIMGHTRTSTTERYVHLDAGDLVQAIDRVSSRVRPRAAG